MVTEFGKVLRDIRLSRNMLLKNMADKLNVSSAYLSGLEHGRYEIPECMIEMIRRTLYLSGQEIQRLFAAEQETKKMKLKFWLDPLAYYPERAHFADAGADVRTPENVTVPAKGGAIVNTGVHLSIPRGYVIFAKSKSGLNVHHGLQVEGVIDAGFTGPIVIKLHNLSDKDYHFKRGDKIAQLVMLPILTPGFERAETLEEIERESSCVSSRGASGWGSTGR